jgi:hypothetical protein
MRAGIAILLAGAFAAAAAGCAVVDGGAFTRLQDEVVGLQREVGARETPPPPPPPPPPARRPPPGPPPRAPPPPPTPSWSKKSAG